LARVLFQFPEESRDILSVLEPATFDTAPSKWLVRKLKAVLKSTGAPATVTVLEHEALRDVRFGLIKAAHVDSYAAMISGLRKKVPDKNYILARSFDYARYISLRDFIVDIGEQVQKKRDGLDWVKVAQRLDDQRCFGSSVMDGGLGTNYGEDLDNRFARRKLFKKNGVPTGIHMLDSLLRHGGLPPGALGLLMAPPGRGKCLHPKTPVLLHSGKVVKAGDVVVGDLLMGPDSKARRVLSTTTGRSGMYKIVPVKGEPWVCNEHHILTLVDTDTGDVSDVSIKDYRFSTAWYKDRHKQFFTGVDFPSRDTALPVDPYFYGVWLGDGSKSLGGVKITKPDDEIRELCRTTAAEWGLNFRECRDKRSGVPTYSITGVAGSHNALLDALRGLWKGRRVPPCYLTASRGERASLLAGLLDTDGHLHYGGYDIVQKCRRLADAVVFLCRSLGLRASIKPKMVPGYGKYWRVSISGDCSFLPLRIPRKKAACRKQIKDVTRTGFKIVPQGRGEYAGFTLSGDGRFLLGDFTVTHNTASLIYLSGSALRFKKKVLFITNELDEDMIAERHDARLSGFYINNLDSKERRAKVRIRKFLKRSGAELRIKYFGSLSVAGLRAYLKRLQAVSFYPDLVILDMADNMDLLEFGGSNSDSDYGPLGRLYKELRIVASDFHVAMWTASQTNRGAVDKSDIDIQDLADSFRKAGVADLIVALAVGEKEARMKEEARNRKRGSGFKLTPSMRTARRLKVAKNRFGPTGNIIPIKFDMGRLRIEGRAA